MLRVNVLSDGFISPNARAMVFPLVVNRERLRSLGLDVRVLDREGPEATDCDALLVDSKVLRPLWAEASDRALEQLTQWRCQTALLWFDTTDSASWINPDVLRIVDLYCKNQLLRDRTLLLRPLYGHRLYTDYYHRTAGVEDSRPAWQTAVEDSVLLDRLRVSWNSGLADWSFAGVYRLALYRHLGWPALLRYPRRFTPPSKQRPIDVSCRMGTSYERESVAWQRREMEQRLRHLMPTQRVSRREYFRELQQSKVVLSPFGWGEINYKDYETFLSGALLLKPDMSHLETWPDLYRSGETVMTHSWDLEDLEDRLDDIVSNYSHYIDVACAGQEAYRRHLASEPGHEEFCVRFKALVREAREARAAPA